MDVADQFVTPLHFDKKYVYILEQICKDLHYDEDNSNNSKYDK